MSTGDGLKNLREILERPMEMKTIDISEWYAFVKDADMVSASAARSQHVAAGAYAGAGGILWFISSVQGAELSVLEVQGAELSELERDLVGFAVSRLQKPDKQHADSGKSDSEKLALKLSDWLQKQLESDAPVFFLPDHLMAGTRLYNEMIPFLLVTEHTNAKQNVYPELEKLLRSFLSEDILLIPLKSQEWLIWGPLSLLKDEDADPGDMLEEESMEDSLASIALGLHEMLASEWLGECHLAVTEPASPSKGMVESAMILRETINLGRKFHVGTNIHLPWMLQLERLLNAIPEANRSKYLEQSLKRADLFVESEMLGTLETFFSLDCNVSETAKKLYIHRNTLLYRLDKLKQETGLDVRQFRDAVLVKIILLLYKVTKRN
ncbi:PucR family transcriptional regulator [Paenibacillus sp. GCM10027627]|uniref:PucR family transcriptional regulator n=1 Tax=unclassified Paenibacillus TaxID=185978 RepID=UPI00362E2D2A